jgi:very-short-patch-repair endonuclease
MPENSRQNPPDCGWMPLSGATDVIRLCWSCESEIERAMLQALCREAAEFSWWSGRRVEFLTPQQVETAGGLDAAALVIRAEHGTRWLVVIVPQYVIGPYRLDFMVRCLRLRPSDGAPLWFSFAVECDGREFHADPDQKESDEERDCRLYRNGVVTLRFSGSEIWRDRYRCANAVFWQALEFFEGKRRENRFFAVAS